MPASRLRTTLVIHRSVSTAYSGCRRETLKLQDLVFVTVPISAKARANWSMVRVHRVPPLLLWRRGLGRGGLFAPPATTHFHSPLVRNLPYGFSVESRLAGEAKDVSSS